MRVLLVGATGFVGSRVLQELLEAGHDVTVLSRRAGAVKVEAVQTIEANVTEARTLEGKLQGIEAVIYLPGLLREQPSTGQTFQAVHFDGVRILYEAMAKQNGEGALRWIQMSALGADRGIPTGYMRTKWLAEEYIRSTPSQWTIVRPSIVFPTEPTPHMNFVSELQKVVRLAPIIPVFGDGQYRLQPVALSELARAIVRSLSLPVTIGKTLEFGGPEKLAYNEIIRRIARSVGSSKALVHLPLGIVRPVVRALEWLPFLPVTDDQIAMLLAGSVIEDRRKEQEVTEIFGAPTLRFLSS